MQSLNQPSDSNNFQSDHIALLQLSLRRLISSELIPKELATGIEAFSAPFALLSHNTAVDPVFNYANQTAMELFELSWNEFTALPSRLSAEAPNREERALLLAKVTAHGFIQNYSGIRISKTGRRFLIEEALVWNLTDEHGVYSGQAALIPHWKYL